MGGSGPLHLRLLGGFTAFLGVEADAHAIAVSSRKGRALLAYLAAKDHPVAGREEIAALLWGERPGRQARQNLRQCLVQLRRDLGPAKDCLVAEAETVALVGTHSDVATLTSLAQRKDPEAAAEAVDLLRGDLLAGFPAQSPGFDGWLAAKRREIDSIAERMLARHVEQLVGEGRGREARVAATRLLACDPDREDWRRLVQTLSMESRVSGEPAAAGSAAAELAPSEPPVPPAQGAGATPAGWFIERLRTPTRAMLAMGVAAAVIGLAVLAGHYGGLFSSRPPEAPAASLSPKSPPSETLPSASLHDPWSSPPPVSQPAEAPRSVGRGVVAMMVLPLQAFGSDGDASLLAEMMTADVTYLLSRLSGVRVISRETARAAMLRPHDLAVLGREFGVRYVLKGAVRRLGGTLRLDIAMMEVSTSAVVWSARIERQVGERVAVEDEIVSRLARELQVELPAIESRRAGGDEDAAALVYKGWAAIWRASAHSTIAAFKEAESLFLAALAKDPENAAARTGLGAFHVSLGAQQLVADPQEHLKTAEAILRGVIEQHPRLAPAHHFLGMALASQGRGREALVQFEISVQINPSAAGSYAHIGNNLLRFGRAAEALEHIRYAMRLSPQDPSLAFWCDFAGIAYLDLKDYPQAIAFFTRATSLNPGYPRGWAGLTAAYALTGDMAKAQHSAERLRALAPGVAPDLLVERFGRHKMSQLREGLRIALTP